MQSLSTYVMILLVIVFSLAAVTYFGSSITGMATTGSSSASSEQIAKAAAECGSPCWNSDKLGAKTFKGNCVEVQNYMLSRYCCFDDDCPKGQGCDTKTGTCAGIAPVAKIQHFKEGILGMSPVIDKITKDNEKINILFVPDKSYKDAMSSFYTDISLYMSDLIQQLSLESVSLESGYTKEQIVIKFNILYIEEMADCHENKYSAGGFSCERSVVEQTREYKNGMLDMIAVLIKPGTRFGDIVRSHAHRNVLVADSTLEFRHGIGHVFGLADEYGNDGFYFTVANYPNVWATP
ncbi:MAG: hypothetical protein HZB66_03135, partial [Candidatus Aenigmarchaeota archaeon]|nr:hypothetical protein [Candidatus Aenigmarchaeota archaeon]